MAKAKLLLFLAAVMLLVGCASAEAAQPAPPQSLWGAVYTLGQTEQTQAPALWATDERVSASWIGADETGVHQDARVLAGGRLLDRVVMPLPPVHPFGQQMFPAAVGGLHLLWLDAGSAVTDENRLYSALITPSFTVDRGPVEMSDRLTLRFAAAAAGDGGVWVVWSGGLLAEPSLYLQYIDRAGRTRPATHLVYNGDWPALARANDGTIYLFWLETTPQFTTIHQAILRDGLLSETSTIGVLASGRLIDTAAGLDNTHLYFFLNLALDDSGLPSSWMLTRPLDGTAWSLPVYPGFTLSDQDSIETGFNSGSANDVRQSGTWLPLRWVRPLPGQFDVLPVAGQAGDQKLAVVYFRGGESVGYQSLLPSANLLGAPMLLSDRDRHLYLAWSEPTAQGYAEMKLTTTRRDRS